MVTWLLLGTILSTAPEVPVPVVLLEFEGIERVVPLGRAAAFAKRGVAMMQLTLPVRPRSGFITNLDGFLVAAQVACGVWYLTLRRA